MRQNVQIPILSPFSKNAKVSKNGFSNMQIIEKYIGPRTTCFLDPGATSATEIGGEKGDQTKDRPTLCVPLFFSIRVLVRTILVREIAVHTILAREK